MMWFTAQKRGGSALSGRILLAGLLTIAVLTTLLSRQAMADVTAVFQADGNEAITIEYRDDDHVRLRSPDGSFIVLTGGSGYIVSREDGQWQVFALDDFRDMMSRMGMAQGGGGASAPVESDVEDGALRDTGRTEMIAGIQGRVHEVVMTDGWDEEVVGELVLSDDADARAAFRGMLRITGLMGDLAGQQGMGEMFDNLYGIEEQAVLRADDGWQLVSIERGSIHDNAFSLPAEPMAIPGFGGGSAAAQSRGQRGGAGTGAGTGAATSDANVDSSEAAQQSWLAREAQDLGAAATGEAADVTEEVVDETRRGVTDDVRDGVRRGVRGLFDR